jgi:hypothetical protein
MILLEIDYFIFSLFNIYYLMIRLFHIGPIKVASKKKNSVSIKLEKLNQDDYCKIMSKINLLISIIYKI